MVKITSYISKRSYCQPFEVFIPGKTLLSFRMEHHPILTSGSRNSCMPTWVADSLLLRTGHHIHLTAILWITTSGTRLRRRCLKGGTTHHSVTLQSSGPELRKFGMNVPRISFQSAKQCASLFPAFVQWLTIMVAQSRSSSSESSNPALFRATKILKELILLLMTIFHFFLFLK